MDAVGRHWTVTQAYKRAHFRIAFTLSLLDVRSSNSPLLDRVFQSQTAHFILDLYHRCKK